ncbi:hypothetical protein PR202_gb07011 [Eleusine coracana subsp. coracana]|uniref:F-box domain-containing protein n=1 Tax=Eleusine coracana subsp. coracana TaxID=191504 RepID=A0AAV5E8M7_ELECO|nr:hypothetical protein PR202_gb07011 [Eleusine coracana subsp. coracana]
MAMASVLPEHLLEEVFIRIGARGDLIRASVACKAFRCLITDPAFFRRYRTLHPPLLLGFVGCVHPGNTCFIPAGSAIRFLPAEAPHPNAPAARAFAAATADFSFHHHPERGRSSWPRYDARDGRVLLMSYDYESSLRRLVSPELSVCDPLTRASALLPPIPGDLLASVTVEGEFLSFFDAFFDPSGPNEETGIRVLCWASHFSMTAMFVYSSLSGSWSHGASIVFSELGLDVLDEYYPIMHESSYAYGCLYWDVHISNKMIKLDISSMESATVTLPSDHENRYTIFVEAGEGRIGMFSLQIGETENLQSLHYSIWQNQS